MSYESEAADAAEWMKAKTVRDLGELTAQWLEGKIRYEPGYRGKPDPETAPLVQVLAELNRSGLYTTQSQPGTPIEGECGQRAWVEGFCDERVAAVITKALLGTDLIVLAAAPGMTSDVQVCITIDDGDAFTSAGDPMKPAHIVDEFEGELNWDAIAALLESWQIIVIDPIWGRHDFLWDLLLKALR